ncbi:MAG: arginine deiminase family protein [Flavobacteriaceae bacterium]|nr:arginine deiminase family protein [Flavobacteriaceae bacterium]
MGTAAAMGAPPNIQDLYDPTSKKHLLAGTFPKKAALQRALADLERIFLRYGVTVLRPDNVVDCNQIFARDLGFVVGDIFVRANIIPHREKELAGLTSLLAQIPSSQQLIFSNEVHVEGGDVIVHNEYIYVGISTRPDYAKLLTARTNKAAAAALQQTFPSKKVKAFELNKSNTIPHENALHLDCCFQPVGRNLALTCPEGFADMDAYNLLVTHFGDTNIFEVSAVEMSQMMCNVVSISPTVVVSNTSFIRLNTWLRQRGITVEEVDFDEIGKQGGLFRCVTLPLFRTP